MRACATARWGPRAAAAARAAVDGASVRERQAAIGELNDVLLDELDRQASDENTLGGALRRESTDALRLRLTLALALLAEGAEKAAHEKAAAAAEAHPQSAAASLVHARCLLRLGRREAARAALRRGRRRARRRRAGAAMDVDAGDDGDEGDDWRRRRRGGGGGGGGPLRRPVGGGGGGAVLRAWRAAERRQEVAADLYERGSFGEAADAYADALSCVEAALRDDRHAAPRCTRASPAATAAAAARDEAIAACDAALALLPRFGRALLRRAVCLLECARTEEAVEAFEVLYRVDRQWPRLSDWLVRPHAAARRKDGKGVGDGGGIGGGGGGDVVAAPNARKRRRRRARRRQRAQAARRRRRSASESDHYVVPG